MGKRSGKSGKSRKSRPNKDNYNWATLAIDAIIDFNGKRKKYDGKRWKKLDPLDEEDEFEIDVEDGLDNGDDHSYASAKAVKSVKDAADKVNLAFTDNTLTFTDADGASSTIDLSKYVDTNASTITSGSLNSNTGVCTFTRDNNTTFTVNMSALLDDTDTNTWRGIQDNLTSTSTTQSLSAKQGKELKTLVDGKASSIHTHNYNNYTHPTTAGNKHIPSGGASGQFLKYSSSGTATWATGGLDGLKGDKGDAGSNGATGAKGDTGSAGSNGATGAKGDTGSAGSNGATGATGAKGNTGASGSPWGGGTFSGAINMSGNDITNVGTMHGRATSANWADLAEKYEADADYGQGVVLGIGGEKEVTEYKTGMKLAGVVSTEPGHRMNVREETEDWPFVALKGRIPVNIIGSAKQGDFILAKDNGEGISVSEIESIEQQNRLIGISLEDGENTVEVKV